MSETQAVAAREFQGVQIPAAGTYVLNPNHKRIGFMARHLMESKVRGQFAEATAAITVPEDPLQSSPTATIQPPSITTGQERPAGPLTTPDFLAGPNYL